MQDAVDSTEVSTYSMSLITREPGQAHCRHDHIRLKVIYIIILSIQALDSVMNVSDRAGLSKRQEAAQMSARKLQRASEIKVIAYILGEF